MKKSFLLIFVLLTFSLPSLAQHGLVKWLTLEEAEKMTKENPKPILIDIYTDWCGWCKRMMQTTYSDPQVANYINENFYPVAFNAEGHDTITWQGKTYVNTEKTHQLTYTFLPKSRSYPSTIFMSGTFQNSTLVPGYLQSDIIAPILVYYKEKLFSGSNINQFMAYFDSTFTPGNHIQHSKTVHWMPLQEALDKNAKHPKKIIVHLYTPDCISCRVMDSTTYTNPLIADYLNKNYYAVRFDATSKDTIEILNQKLVNNGYYHDLALGALKDKIHFPTVLFFNEKNELIAPVSEYMTPDFFEAVCQFFKEDIYLKKQFAAFYKTFKKL